MKKALLLLLAPAYMLLVTNVGCHSNYGSKEPVKVYFWKNSDAGTAYRLYIDDSIKGILPYVPESVGKQQGGALLTQAAMHMLKPGKYSIKAMDSASNVLCEGSLLIKIRKGSSTEIRTRWDNNHCSVFVLIGN